MGIRSKFRILRSSATSFSRTEPRALLSSQRSRKFSRSEPECPLRFPRNLKMKVEMPNLSQSLKLWPSSLKKKEPEKIEFFSIKQPRVQKNFIRSSTFQV